MSHAAALCTKLVCGENLNLHARLSSHVKIKLNRNTTIMSRWNSNRHSRGKKCRISLWTKFWFNLFDIANYREKSDFVSKFISPKQRCDNRIIARRNSAPSARARLAQNTSGRNARRMCVRKCSTRRRIMSGTYLGSYARRRVPTVDADSHTDRRRV